MANYPTPHIQATPDDFAKTVLMPGDPLRSKYIAETYLQDCRLVNDVRGIQGYTGFYNGQRVSVMASGMGIPSIGIYSYELYSFFGVENILRIGTTGSISESLKIRDVVLGQAACTTSSWASQYGLNGTYAPIADFSLLRKAVEIAEKKDLSVKVGNLLSADVYYDDDPHALDPWKKMGVLSVEMEAAGLYMNAARTGKRALAICTVSNSILTGEETTAAERQAGLNDMILLALDLAVVL